MSMRELRKSESNPTFSDTHNDEVGLYSELSNALVRIASLVSESSGRAVTMQDGDIHILGGIEHRGYGSHVARPATKLEQFMHSGFLSGWGIGNAHIQRLKGIARELDGNVDATTTGSVTTMRRGASPWSMSETRSIYRFVQNIQSHIEQVYAVRKEARALNDALAGLVHADRTSVLLPTGGGSPKQSPAHEFSVSDIDPFLLRLHTLKLDSYYADLALAFELRNRVMTWNFDESELFDTDEAPSLDELRAQIQTRTEFVHDFMFKFNEARGAQMTAEQKRDITLSETQLLIENNNIGEWRDKVLDLCVALKGGLISTELEAEIFSALRLARNALDVTNIESHKHSSARLALVSIHEKLTQLQIADVQSRREQARHKVLLLQPVRIAYEKLHTACARLVPDVDSLVGLDFASLRKRVSIQEVGASQMIDFRESLAILGDLKKIIDAQYATNDDLVSVLKSEGLDDSEQLNATMDRRIAHLHQILTDKSKNFGDVVTHNETTPTIPESIRRRPFVRALMKSLSALFLSAVPTTALEEIPLPKEIPRAPISSTVLSPQATVPQLSVPSSTFSLKGNPIFKEITVPRVESSEPDAVPFFETKTSQPDVLSIPVGSDGTYGFKKILEKIVPADIFARDKAINWFTHAVVLYVNQNPRERISLLTGHTFPNVTATTIPDYIGKKADKRPVTLHFQKIMTPEFWTAFDGFIQKNGKTFKTNPDLQKSVERIRDSVKSSIK